MTVGAAWLVLLLVGASSGQLRPISQADSVVAVYSSDWGLGSDGRPKLMLVAWADGNIVWSEDRVHGGPPYLQGRVPAARVAAALGRCAADGFFDDRTLGLEHFGPDSAFVTILLRSGGRALQMRSWHELAEGRGRLVARSGGLAPLSGERRLAVVRKEPAAYLYYRAAWSELREVASSLIPAESLPAAGEVVMKAGVLAWRDTGVP